MLPSSDFTPNIVPVFKSPQEVTQKSFQRPNICHAICLIGSGRAENAVQVTKALKDVVNQPISIQTIGNGLKKVGSNAVVKKKRPRFTPHHREERLDFAIRYQHWTLED